MHSDKDLSSNALSSSRLPVDFKKGIHGEGKSFRSTVTSTIELDDQITYSWQAINVTHFPKGRFINLFMTKKKSEKTSKSLLKNVNGIAKPGELLALMGASGAGKSTLLNTLTFRGSRKLLTTGERHVNGITADNRVMPFLSAYVQQEDVFLGNLTVIEHLHFASKVMTSRGTKKSIREDRIENLLEELNLIKCRNTRIGLVGKKKGISGGEKKRLAFATALLNNPPLLFCDEPTSGLDSFMSKSVVTMLKKLANQGRTIVTTIHQPSSEVYFLFDKVMFLSEGRVIFLGTPAEANQFFSSVGAPCPANFNPADFFVTRISTMYEDSAAGAQPQIQFLEKTAVAYNNSKYAKAVLDEIHYVKVSLMEKKKARLSFRMDNLKRARYQQPWGVQFCALIVRSFFDLMKSRELVTMKFFQTIIVALLFGVLYWNQGNDQDAVMNINGAIFISVMNLCLQNTFSVIHVFIDEMPVFLKEHYDGMYRVDAYFLSKTLVELPVQIILPVIYISIMYYMAKFNQDASRFFWHMLILIILSNIGTSFGYFIGICTSDLGVALNVASPILIPLMLFSGFLLNIETMTKWISWFRYVSFFYYSMESLLVTQWDGVNDIKCTRPLTSCPQNGSVVLGMYSYKPANFEFDMYMMLANILCYRIMALILLHIRVIYKG